MTTPEEFKEQLITSKRGIQVSIDWAMQVRKVTDIDAEIHEDISSALHKLHDARNKLAIQIDEIKTTPCSQCGKSDIVVIHNNSFNIPLCVPCWEARSQLLEELTK